MKKIAAIITFLLAFTISANAQESKSMATVDDAAKKDVVELASFLELNDEEQINLLELFKYKHQVMNDPATRDEEKTQLSENIVAKINGTLDPKQQQKLAANPELLEKLSK